MHTLGRFGEQCAVDYLMSLGHRILKQNYHTRFGEIDVFSQLDNRLHVVEVKTLSRAYIPIGYKINRRKRQRMIHATCLFLDQFNLWSMYVQFDLIIVHNNQVKHVENCFSLTDV